MWGQGLRQHSCLPIVAYIFFSLTLVFVAVKNKPVHVSSQNRNSLAHLDSVVLEAKFLTNKCGALICARLHAIC